ncbi:MAG: MarC family protein [Bacteroidota bacterium]|nr:MarC family protein [Bacteroidota bacterium]
MNWSLYVNFLIALIAIINPVSILPMWSELTSDKSNKVRVKVASMLIGFAIIALTIFLVAGKYILGFFGIDLIVFKVAGGVLLMTTGIKMIEGRNVRLPRKMMTKAPIYNLPSYIFAKLLFPWVFPFLLARAPSPPYFFLGLV